MLCMLNSRCRPLTKKKTTTCHVTEKLQISHDAEVKIQFYTRIDAKH